MTFGEFLGLNLFSRSSNQKAKRSNPGDCRFCIHWRDLGSQNSRGDKTPLELFVASVWAWEAGSRQQVESGYF